MKIIKAKRIDSYGNDLGEVLINPHEIARVEPGHHPSGSRFSEFYSVIILRDGKSYHVKLMVEEVEKLWGESL